MKHKEVRFTFSSLYATGKVLSIYKECTERTLARLHFKRLPCSATDKWDGISDVIMSLPSTSYVSGAFIFFLVPRKVRFAAHKHNPLSIYRKVKSKDNFHAKARLA